MSNATLVTGKVEMACACGKLRGHGVNISPKTGRHLVCMCKDCQAYTRFLGRSDELLNENGGSEIFQITPAQIKLESGLEHLACMRLSPKGTLRWYASCCNTPIANTLPSPALPFAGISCTFIAPQDPHSKETALGPIRQRIFGSEGYGKMPAGTKDKVSVMDIVQTIFWILANKLKGKAKPSPFFGHDKAPIVEPKVLTKDERMAFTKSPDFAPQVMSAN